SFYLRKALRRHEHQSNIQSCHNASTATAPVNIQLSGSGEASQVQGTAHNNATNLDMQQNSGPKGLPHFDTNAPPASLMVVPSVPEGEENRNRQKSSRGGPHNGGYDDKNNDYILKDGECFNARSVSFMYKRSIRQKSTFFAEIA
ncbi:hypothetical protein GCK32_018772, partial [Trichostrongylus colubriformis]